MTEEAVTEEVVDAEPVDLSEHAAGVPPEEKLCDYFDEHPAVAEAFRAAGYEGDCWFKLRTLNASQRRDRQFTFIQGEAGIGEVGISADKLFRFDAQHMIMAARFPTADGKGKWRQYVWDAGVGSLNKHFDQLATLGPKLDAWLQDKLEGMAGESDESAEAIATAGNSSTAAVSS